MRKRHSSYSTPDMMEVTYRLAEGKLNVGAGKATRLLKAPISSLKWEESFSAEAKRSRD